MNGQEMMRLIDSISRDRNVDKEVLFRDIEQAMVSAARKHFNAVDTEEFFAELDRMNGSIRVWRGEEEIPLSELGRIPAQTAKQVMIQRFREDERNSIYTEFADRAGELVTGMAQRYEGGALVISIGRAEGFMPRSEQIPGEQHQPGERVRCLILDVRDAGNQVKIVLSRAHADFIRRLFEVEVPEVSERIIEIKAMAREAGHRTKIAVSSIDSKVDAVGACVGVRGSRIKNIVDELGGEKIDIVRWNESSQILIQNALKPAEVAEISLCFELGRATVVVNEDQLSLAIGKRGQNVRLAARLTNWDIDILTPAEYTKGLDTLEQSLTQIDGINEDHIDRLAALGVISVFDVEEVGVDYLVESIGLESEMAQKVVTTASEKAREVAEQQQHEKEAAERRKRGEMALPGDDQAAAILGEAAPSSGDQAGESAGYGNQLGGGGEDQGSILEMLESRQSEEGGDVPGGPTKQEAGEDVGEHPGEDGSRDEALSEDPAKRDEELESEPELDEPVGDSRGEGADPAGGDPADIDATEARQQGEAGEAMADMTGPEAGVVGGTAGEATEPEQTRASDEPGDVDWEDAEREQATVEPESDEEERRE